MGIDISSFPRVVRDAAMSVIKKRPLAWGGVKEKEEESKAERTVAPLPFASVGGERWVWPEEIAEAKTARGGEGRKTGHRGRAGGSRLRRNPGRRIDGRTARLARDGLGAAVKTGATAGSFVTSGMGTELKGFAAETAAEFKVLRRYIGRLVCGR